MKEAVKCPNCGANELDGCFCAYCGTQLLREDVMATADFYHEKDSFDTPVGEYIGCNCNVVLEENAVEIKQFLFGESGLAGSVRIPYHQISGVHFFRPEDKCVTWGYIVVRWAENEHLPLLDRKALKSALNEEKCRNGVVTFDGLDEQVFFHIFCFLKAKGSAWAQCSVDDPVVSITGRNLIAQGIDFDGCFRKYSPYRKEAIAELCKKTKIKRKTMKVLVDEAFDRRQMELYAKQPHMAIRDLNRVVRQAIMRNEKYTVKL